MSIQAKIEQPDGVQITVTADSAADVVGIAMSLLKRIGAEAQPERADDCEPAVSIHGIDDLVEAMESAFKNRRARLGVS